MINILDHIKVQQEKNLPFVVYRKQHETGITGIFQDTATLFLSKDLSETGFVFAPFDSRNLTILIPEAHSEVIRETFVPKVIKSMADHSFEADDKTRQHFETLVASGVAAIEEGRFSKVVLSRKEMVVLQDKDCALLFEKLLQAYPAAFVYIWYHPEIGLWMGATPEKLMQSDGGHFTTMALAGTQKYQDTEEVHWPEKERQEQLFVTDFIVQELRDFTTEIKLSSPHTLRAGGIVHIKTDITGTLKAGATVKEVVTVLHPTPAVCGLPKENAKQFILAAEGYDREFYSGFLGELQKNFQTGQAASDFYVNLRCMQLIGNEANLYIGCGITRDSDPEKEFQETVNKAMTMKRVLL